MGSASSSSRSSTPTTTQTTAPRTSRNTGFREVQFEQPEGASSARRSQASTPRGGQKTENHRRWRHGYDSMEQPESFSDLSSVAGQMQRERTMMTFSESEQPKYAKDDMVMETYYHQNGSTYSCLYQGGQRFYLDSFQTQDWHPFPKAWYSQGVLVTDRFIKDEDLVSQSSSQSSSAGSRSHQSQQQSRQQSSTQGRAAQYEQRDDREGFIEHPTRGRLQTYVFEEKRNVHYFFDRDSGNWVRLPVSWELYSDIVKKLLLPIQDALPEWKDQHDIVAALRASNYDPQDCVNTYLGIGDQDSLRTPKSTADFKLLQEKDEEIQRLTQELDALKRSFEKARRGLDLETKERKSAEKQIQKLQDDLSSLEVTATNATARLDAMLQERPKTARPPSARARTPAKTPEPENQVDPDTVIALNNSMKQLHKLHIKLKMESKQKIDELKQLIKQLAVGVLKVRLCDNGQSNELQDLRELYRKEALQRKLLYNKLQELRGNIRVFCRCRYDDRTECCLQFPNDHEVLTSGAKKGLKFDKVFTPRSTQQEVFDEAFPIITSCVDGYNVCILAYGQTGSGKTYTMQGPQNDPGVNVRALKELLRICEEKENVDYKLTASMVEIYNETIVDLLRSDTRTLDIRTKGNKIILPGVTEMEVEDLKDISKIIKLGEKNRTTAATKMNSTSSRSHLILMINVEGHDKSSGAVTTGTLTLCDLAGSERVGKTEAQGQRLVEAAAINKSLSSLGQVFTALRTGQLHVPYRNSKLTHILQPSLGGDAKACLFVAVSPDQNNLLETTSTLQFGSSARQVALGQAKQNIKKAPQGGFGMNDV